MGALTSNRKRGDGSVPFSYNFPIFNSDNRADTISTQKHRTSSSSMQSTSEYVGSLASKVYRYPKPVNRISREVHAPCKWGKFRFFPSWNRESRQRSSEDGKEKDLADLRENLLSKKYCEAKDCAFETFRYIKKDEEVIDVDAETVRGEGLEDSCTEEVVEVEDGREWQTVVSDNRSRMENGKVVDVEHYFQPSSSSAVSDSTRVPCSVHLNCPRQCPQKDIVLGVLEMLLLNPELDGPVRKKIAEMLNHMLKNLSSLLEMICATLQLSPPGKRPQDEGVLQDALYEPFIPLTEEEKAEVSQALSKSSWRKVLATHEDSNIEITGELMRCLRPGEWLNDEVINVYLQLLKEREKRKPKKFLKCHFFNTFFYKKLISGKNGYDFKSVRRWTSQKKLGYCLLECDKIFVPIHKEFHWCLAVINNKDEKFQYLDSLRGTDHRVLKVLARYFVEEVRDKSEKDIDVCSWKQEHVKDLPEQENGSDCGMFMIKYADFYSRDIGLHFKQENIPYFRQRTAKEILSLKAE